MSSGNVTTEETKREALEDAAVIEAASLVRNALLRRALAYAARDYVELKAGGLPTLPDAGSVIMLCWVMEAAEKQESDGERMDQRREGGNTMNMIEAIQERCNYIRDTILPEYNKIGQAGQFGKAMLQADIADAERVIAGGDAVEMIRTLAALRETCERAL